MTQTQTYEIATPAAWSKPAADVAGTVPRPAILLLSGPLGAGKTTFVQVLWRALGLVGATPVSPTFSLIERYNHSGEEYVHADLYRLAADDPALLAELEEAAAEASLTAVEWPERLRLAERLPTAWSLQFTIEPAGRRLTVQPPVSPLERHGTAD